jgi:hypothetical protein
MQVKRQLRRLGLQALSQFVESSAFVGAATSRVSPTREYKQLVQQCSPCPGR